MKIGCNCARLVKYALGRPDFGVGAGEVRRELLDNGYDELSLTGLHAQALAGLPPIHKDPFDRLLVAQAMVEGITLLTSDKTVARYPGAVQRV